jgi:hypothetical protein
MDFFLGLAAILAFGVAVSVIAKRLREGTSGGRRHWGSGGDGYIYSDSGSSSSDSGWSSGDSDSSSGGDSSDAGGGGDSGAGGDGGGGNGGGGGGD